MEAKARVTGPDGLEKLVASWLRLREEPGISRGTNAGRKFSELLRLTEHGPVLVWLVAEGARWALWAQPGRDGLRLSPADTPDRSVVEGLVEGSVLEGRPYDRSRHRPGTAAHAGHCSWHGPVSCGRSPIVSFCDAQGRWQSGCQRAVDELVARGQLRFTDGNGQR